MPELAEVAYFSGRWNPGLGECIQRVDVNRDVRCFRGEPVDSMIAALEGARYLSAETHGKRMLFRFSGEVWLGLHLGMTGKLRCEDLGEPLKTHDHLVLTTKKRRLIFSDSRQFGRGRFHQGGSAPDWWSDLPLEVLSRKFDYAFFERICERRKGAVLKAFLLLQEWFPGVGNWMADEILWRARVRPGRRAGDLSREERKALFEALKFVCRGAMKYVAPDWSDLPRTWLFRHRWKDGGLCPQTGSPLKREQIGGRTTCWSESWQR